MASGIRKVVKRLQVAPAKSANYENDQYTNPGMFPRNPVVVDLI